MNRYQRLSEQKCLNTDIRDMSYVCVCCFGGDARRFAFSCCFVSTCLHDSVTGRKTVSLASFANELPVTMTAGHTVTDTTKSVLCVSVRTRGPVNVSACPFFTQVIKLGPLFWDTVLL